MRIFAAVFAVLLAPSAVLAQSDGRTRPDPKPAAEAKAKPAAEAKAKPAKKPKAAPKKVEPKTEAAAKPQPTTDGKSKASRKKEAKEKPKAAAAKAATNGSANAAAPEKASPALRDAYNALSFADRIAMQSDLAWGGDYSGPINGEFSDQLAEAARAYQRRHKEPVTGLLTPEQRTALGTAVAPRKDAVGWRLIEDTTTGARVGVPGKYTTKEAPAPNGTRWSSEQGQLQIQTFRIDTGATLEAVFEQQKKVPRRHLEGSALQGDSFVIRGMQGLKKMVVRGFARDGEVRGLSILYDQAMEGSIDPLVAPMTSAYVPFPSFTVASAASQPRRKVEYGTGVFVSSLGHVLTDRRLVDGCDVITLPAVGNAERLALDGDSGLALLRVYGAQSTAIEWSGAPDAAGALTLVGVADPQAQAGADAVSTTQARPGSVAGTLDAAPSPGFSGSAAVDGQGRFAGVVVSKPAQVAGPAGAPQAHVVSVERIRSFLVSNHLTLASGKPGLDEAKAAVTRVICVRN